jgi:Ca-activated chloride channel family protein
MKAFFVKLYFIPVVVFILILGWYFTAFKGPFESLWITDDQRGWLYYKDGAYKKAAAAFENMAFKAAALYKARKFEAAEKLYRPMHDPVAHYNHGNCFVMVGQYEKAVYEYHKALAGRPGFSVAEQNLAIAQRLLDEKQREARENELKGKPVKGKPIGLQQKEKNKRKKKPEGKPNAMVKVPATALWLDTLHTGPKEFLKLKFAYQHKKEQEDARR